MQCESCHINQLKLPVEAFEIVIKEIENNVDEGFFPNGYALLYLKNPQTLDWIENIDHHLINIPTDWGTIAAASQFSWDRAEKWLTTGRPLSLIALDALVLCCTANEKQNQSEYWRENPLQFLNPAAIEIMARTVTLYLERDRVPRTKTAVGKIISNLFGTTPY